MQIPDYTVIASWPAPNYINPETRGPGAVIFIAFLLLLVTALLIIRVYTRLVISKGFGMDDKLILLAYIPTLVYAIVSFVASAKFGWGIHVWDVEPRLYTPGLQISLVVQNLFNLSTGLTKLSILALLWRLVSVDRWCPYRYVVLCLVVAVSLSSTLFLFITIFQCGVPGPYWTLSVEPQDCIDERKHLLAAGCLNTLLDLILVLLPIPIVIALHLPRRQQIIVASLFAGGFVVTAAGAVRTYVTFKLFSNQVDADLTWNAIAVLHTSSLELFMGILVANIPPTKPFFARYLPHHLGHKDPPSPRPRAALLPHEKLDADGKLSWDFFFPYSPAHRPASSGDYAYDIEAHSATATRTPTRGPPPHAIPATAVPARPSRTHLNPLSMHVPDHHHHPPHAPRSPRSSSSSTSSTSTASTAILGGGGGGGGGATPVALLPPDLNKPLPYILPHIKRASRLQAMINEHVLEWAAEGASGTGERPPSPSSSSLSSSSSSSTRTLSVYQLVPYEDGHISVHMSRERSYTSSPIHEP